MKIDCIKIEAYLSKNDGSEFTEEDIDNLTDKVVELAESLDMNISSVTEPCKEEEVHEAV